MHSLSTILSLAAVVLAAPHLRGRSAQQASTAPAAAPAPAPAAAAAPAAAGPRLPQSIPVASIPPTTIDPQRGSLPKALPILNNIPLPNLGICLDLGLGPAGSGCNRGASNNNRNGNGNGSGGRSSSGQFAEGSQASRGDRSGDLDDDSEGFNSRNRKNDSGRESQNSENGQGSEFSESEGRFRNGGQGGGLPVCTGLYSSPQCCGLDVLALADLDCTIGMSRRSSPHFLLRANNGCFVAPGQYTDPRAFKQGCSRKGKQAKCCTLPVAGQGVLCQDVAGANP